MKRLTFLLLLSGCALLPKSPPARHYLLPDPSPCPFKAAFSEPLAVEEVAIPAYLDRRELLTVHRDGRVEVAEQDRLLEPVDRALQRLLILTLSGALDRPVVPAPARGARRLEVRVLKFHIEEGEKARLLAVWRLDRGSWREVALEVPVAERGISGRLRALSEAAGRLGCQIAGEIGRRKR